VGQPRPAKHSHQDRGQTATDRPSDDGPRLDRDTTKIMVRTHGIFHLSASEPIITHSLSRTVSVVSVAYSRRCLGGRRPTARHAVAHVFRLKDHDDRGRRGARAPRDARSRRRRRRLNLMDLEHPSGVDASGWGGRAATLADRGSTLFDFDPLATCGRVRQPVRAEHHRESSSNAENPVIGHCQVARPIAKHHDLRKRTTRPDNSVKPRIIDRICSKVGSAWLKAPSTVTVSAGTNSSP